MSCAMRLREAAWATMAALGFVLSFAVESRAQPLPDPNTGIRAAPSGAVAGLTVEGIVIESETGRPLQAAQVFVEAANVGVLSQPDGRFTLRLPAAGDHLLVVNRIGLKGVSLILSASDSRGIAVQVSLERDRFGGGCGLIVCSSPEGCPPSFVVAEVRDLFTNQAPTVPVVVTARSASYETSQVVPPISDDSLEVLLPIAERPRRGLLYQVEVASESHSTWRADDVWLGSDPCTTNFGPRLHVRLLPR